MLAVMPKIWIYKDYKDRYAILKDFRNYIKLEVDLPSWFSWYTLGYLEFQKIQEHMLSEYQAYLLFEFFRDKYFTRIGVIFPQAIYQQLQAIYTHWPKYYFLFLDKISEVIQRIGFNQAYAIYEAKIKKIIKEVEV